MVATCEPTRSSSSSTPTANPRPSRACRPTTLLRTGSSGVIRSTTGLRMQPMASRGGGRASSTTCNFLMPCASTIFAASATTGASPQARPMPVAALGTTVRAWPSPKRWATYHWSQKTWAYSPQAWTSCATPLGFLAWQSCNLVSEDRLITRITQTTSRRTGSSIRARTTTIPSAVGSRAPRQRNKLT